MTDTSWQITACLEPGAAANAAIHELLAECKRHDRAAVPENFDKTLNAYRDMKSWFLAYNSGQLRGMVSIFAPNRSEAEVIAAVHPEWRREGTFTALIEEATGELLNFGYRSILFVNDPGSTIGNLVVGKTGARHEFSEYTLRYEPDDESHARLAAALRLMSGPGSVLSVRKASSSDLEAMTKVGASAFDDDPADARAFISNSLSHPRRSFFVLLQDNEIVAKIGHLHEENNDYINAFAVHKDMQGKGMGKILLAWLVDRVERGSTSAESAAEILMDVDSTNDAAFGLYRSMGFRVVRSADYYRFSIKR